MGGGRGLRGEGRVQHQRLEGRGVVKWFDVYSRVDCVGHEGLGIVVMKAYCQSQDTRQGESYCAIEEFSRAVLMW